jgi:hypothetical protein
MGQNARLKRTEIGPDNYEGEGFARYSLPILANPVDVP